MPEGPEIRIAADRVENALTSSPIMDSFFAFDQLKGYEEVIKGASVNRVDSKGKAMLIRFDNGYTIYSHNQLYGKWVIRNVYNYPKTNRQLRLALHNEKKSALLYSASDIDVLRDEEVTSHPYIAKVGPDILSEEVLPEALYDRFLSKLFTRRKWAGLLLDQSFIAGIGNYLRSEILFVAKIPPSFRPVDCTDVQLRTASHAAVDLVVQSYKTGGITTAPDIVETLKKKGYTRKKYRHWVFGRAGLPCRVCGSSIMKETLAGRRLYFCPVCQKE
ncbi:endonuclease VIII [Alteribacter lacisalsi]|uniref:Formamidopyrimidine-DNA glycosylase n=1 Tax=Alteribacter lacisalsi TaxID=2045244 RepID=A0A2W0H4X3_9BACI|nr:endonuclease VIII [Alteribacter lacisalsi]PYZ96207.1 endonuclease VIII [Alteribacter lacisalsi]